MAPFWRKAALVAHIASSVGWCGVVATSLVMAAVALGNDDPRIVRAVYLVLEPLGWYALVPFSLASLVTGLIQSLGTRWGLFRHYWVIVKLAMNLLATGVLLLYMQTLAYLSEVAATSADVRDLRTPSPVVHAAGAILLLIVALVLSVYKPRGLTGHGIRRLTGPQADTDARAAATSAS
jgi:hypothetical protein